MHAVRITRGVGDWRSVPLRLISGSMGEGTKPLTDLPSDILLQTFTQCDVLYILSLSSVRE